MEARHRLFHNEPLRSQSLRSRWTLSSQCFSWCGAETGWYLWISRTFTCRFQSIQTAASFPGSYPSIWFSSSRHCVLVSPLPLKSSRESWLRYRLLHRAGIRIRRYLDDWLIQAPSYALVLQALDTVLQLCQDLGIVVNWEKPNLVPSQWVVYLEVILDSLSFRASPSQLRVEKLLSIGNEFLSSAAQPVPWRMLLGVLLSLTPLVPGVAYACGLSNFSIARGIRWTTPP